MSKFVPVPAILLLICSALLGGLARAAEQPRLNLSELRSRYADPAGHIANIDGVDVYYKDEGAGPAILMVHGSVSTLKTYDDVSAALLSRYRVIRYDIPGQGLSGPVSDAVAVRLEPADIAIKLLEKLGVRSVTAVGVSSGGTLCFFLAAKRPDLVERLVLANTPADPVETSHLAPSREFAEAQREAIKQKFQSQRFWNLFLDYFSGVPARITPEIREQYYDFNRRSTEPNMLSMVARVADHDKAVATMAKVKAPTLLVWGAADPLLTPPSAAALAGYLANAQVSQLYLPDVGHYPPLEAPERFARIVATYIESVAPR